MSPKDREAFTHYTGSPDTGVRYETLQELWEDSCDRIAIKYKAAFTAWHAWRELQKLLHDGAEAVARQFVDAHEQELAAFKAQFATGWGGAASGSGGVAIGGGGAGPAASGASASGSGAPGGATGAASGGAVAGVVPIPNPPNPPDPSQLSPEDLVTEMQAYVQAFTAYLASKQAIEAANAQIVAAAAAAPVASAGSGPGASSSSGAASGTVATAANHWGGATFTYQGQLWDPIALLFRELRLHFEMVTAEKVRAFDEFRRRDGESAAEAAGRFRDICRRAHQSDNRLKVAKWLNSLPADIRVWIEGDTRYRTV